MQLRSATKPAAEQAASAQSRLQACRAAQLGGRRRAWSAHARPAPPIWQATKWSASLHCSPHILRLLGESTTWDAHHLGCTPPGVAHHLECTCALHEKHPSPHPSSSLGAPHTLPHQAPHPNKRYCMLKPSLMPNKHVSFFHPGSP